MSTVIVEVGTDDMLISVVKNEQGSYDVFANGVKRHPDCDPEAAMRALGNYLHSALCQLESKSLKP